QGPVLRVDGQPRRPRHPRTPRRAVRRRAPRSHPQGRTLMSEPRHPTPAAPPASPASPPGSGPAPSVSVASSGVGEILGDVTTKRRGPDPTAIVIFGATADLAGRKLAPALYNLMLDSALTDPTVIIGASRGELTAPQFADHLLPRVTEFSRRKLEPAVWD